MPRPFWSGHMQISLVSFGVKLFPATEAKSEIHFHQLSRKTGERIRHQKVSSSDDATPVEKDEIVKGYEYRKGEYVTIEPSDIEHIRIPSRHSLEVTQFVNVSELRPELFEKPYFVVPENDQQAEAFAVVRKAMQTEGKAALGKIAFGGREHLVAISAPDEKDEERGMMAYTLRYAEELRDPAEYFGEIKKTSIDSDQLSLAKELIKRKSSPFKPDAFKDEYEVALKQMVEAKVNNAPLPAEEPAPKSGKVINLMDALRKSIAPASESKPSAPAKKLTEKPAEKPADKKGPRLVKPVPKATQKAAKPTRQRKSA
jgi:DNA end-binding protein Ku